MTEWEKCEAGMLYYPSADECEQLHIRCADLCWQFNHARPSDKRLRKELLREIFGGAGENIYVEPNLFCGYGRNIFVGDNFFANNNCVFLDNARITFGDNVLIAPNCGFYTAGHPFDVELRRDGLEYAKPIVVGDDVWFGAGCSVLPGVTIGSNVVIGAGSVVNVDIPDGVLAVGNPCRVIRTIGT